MFVPACCAKVAAAPRSTNLEACPPVFLCVLGEFLYGFSEASSLCVQSTESSNI